MSFSFFSTIFLHFQFGLHFLTFFLNLFIIFCVDCSHLIMLSFNIKSNYYSWVIPLMFQIMGYTLFFMANGSSKSSSLWNSKPSYFVRILICTTFYLLSLVDIFILFKLTSRNPWYPSFILRIWIIALSWWSSFCQYSELCIVGNIGI